MSLPFRTLGLGGGGVKGVLQIGALRELSKHQPLVFPSGIYGCSVGSILATYVAFGLPIHNTSLVKYLSIDAILPTFNLQTMTTAFSSKGMYTMDKFESNIIAMFDDAGVDIRGKTLGDASMPLYIVASNITKGTPTVFSGNVPVLHALKASCCIPGLFRPYALYNQLYVDGDTFVPNVASVMPSTLNDTALVLILSKHKGRSLTPEMLEDMSPLEYTTELYNMGRRIFQDAPRFSNTLALAYPELYSHSDLSDMDISDIFARSGRQLEGFLRSKCLC